MTAEETIIELRLARHHQDRVLVVRIRTSYFTTKRGFAVRKDVTVLRRLSDPDATEQLLVDAEETGVDTVVDRMLGFDELRDGVYEVRTCPRSRDRETGLVEEWDYNLTPYKPR